MTFNLLAKMKSSDVIVKKFVFLELLLTIRTLKIITELLAMIIKVNF